MSFFKEYVIKSKLYNLQQWEPETAKRKSYFFIFILKEFLIFNWLFLQACPEIAGSGLMCGESWILYAWSRYPTRTRLNLIWNTLSLSYGFPCRVWPSRDIKGFKDLGLHYLKLSKSFDFKAIKKTSVFIGITNCNIPLHNQKKTTIIPLLFWFPL